MVVFAKKAVKKIIAFAEEKIYNVHLFVLVNSA